MNTTNNNILITKIQTPSLRGPLVHRSELYIKLDKVVNHKLLLVSAPAGFGKTTLISSWIKQNNIQASWLSVSSFDNDPVVFLIYIINALRQNIEGFGDVALELLHHEKQPALKPIVNLIINELIIQGNDLFLVIDDFHLLDNIEINEIFNHLLNYAPDNFHLVIITRCDPNLQLSRLRVQQQLFEIRADDLSFTKNDVSVLFNKVQNLHLSETNIEKLHTKTEGWIAGLLLTSISLQGNSDPTTFINNFSGTDSYIIGYLMDEVLEKQSIQTKDFLIRTSILEDLSPALCDFLLERNDSHIIFHELAANNMFLFSQDSSNLHYRYHHLFADLLQQRLHEENNNQIRELNNRAADWYIENNFICQAIQHAIKARNYKKGTAFFSQHIAALWKENQYNTIINIGKNIPSEFLLNEPEVCFYYSWVLIDIGKIHQATLYIEHIMEYNTLIVSAQLSGKIAIVCARFFIQQPDFSQTMKCCKYAIDTLNNEDDFWLSWAWHLTTGYHLIQNNIEAAIHAYNKGLAYANKANDLNLISFITISVGYLEFRLGQLHASYKRCENLLNYIQQRGYAQYAKDESSYALLYVSMAAIEYYWMDLDNSVKNIALAYKLTENDTNIIHKALVLINYSLINYLTSGKNGSLQKLEESEVFIHKSNLPPEVYTLYVSWKAFLMVNDDKLYDAELFFNEQQLYSKNNIAVYEVHRYTPLALWLILSSRFDEANELLTKLFGIVNVAHRVEHKVEISILWAIMYIQLGEIKLAQLKLIDSMEYASDENILVYYLLYCHRINSLFNDVFKTLATQVTTISDKFIMNLKNALVKYNKRQQYQNNLIDLTGRELEVLKLIDEHLTNQQIAEKLFISLHTVKSHVKNILLKLDVDRRTKVGDKAHELGINF